MHGYTASAAIMILAGLGIPMLAAMNAALGRILGSPATAAAIAFAVAGLVALAVALATGARFGALAAAPRATLLAGLLVAFYLLSITWIAPRFGVGNAVFFVLLGQLVSALAVDRLGLFGAPVVPMSPIRVAGVAVMAVGVFLTQVAGR